MMNKKYAVFLLAAALAPLFASCAARISGSLQSNGQADLSVTTSLEPGITRLIRALSSASGAPQQGPVLDGPALSASMSAAPGIASVSLRNTSPETVEGPVRISRVDDLLRSGGTAGFVSFGQDADGGRLAVSINRDTGPEILTLVSPDINGYLGALMAPIATGEFLTKAEYLALVGSVYGRAVADEMSKSLVRVSVEFPGTVRSAAGGTFSGRRAEFAVPLLDILVLETPLRYEVTWR